MPRLVDCIEGTGDQNLRAWALSLLAVLISTPRFREAFGRALLPPLTALLAAYADSGDPKVLAPPSVVYCEAETSVGKKGPGEMTNGMMSLRKL